MKQLLSARIFQIFVAIILAFVAMELTLPTLVLREMLDSMLVALSVVAVFIYAPQALVELQKNKLDRVGLLITGITLAWCFTLVTRSLAVTGRAFGRLGYIVDSTFFTFMIYVGIVSAVLHILAPGADPGAANSDRNKAWLRVAVVAGVLLAGFFLGMRAGLWLGDFHNPPPMTG